MDVEIIDEDENPMLHRTDVRFQLTHEDATPSRLSVRDSLAAKLNKDAGEVIVHRLDTKYGMRKTVGYAKVYEDVEAAETVEQDYLLERNKHTGDGADATEEAEPPAEEASTDEGEPDPEADTDEAEVDASDAADVADDEDEDSEADDTDADEDSEADDAETSEE